MADKKKLTTPLSGLKGCYVAGGAITSLYTNKPINDFDIYPKSDEALNEAIRWAYEDSGYWCVDHSSRAMTFAKGEKDEHPNIQIMHFDTFETAQKIFDTFDFTCCMGAFDLDDEGFVLHPMFLEHCSQRYLSFNTGTRFPYASGWRVNKYREKGFTIGKIEYQKILLACAAKPITSWEDLKEQIGGVYGEAITIPENEEFTQEGMWRALETLTFKGPSGGFDSVEVAIAMMSRTPIKCFRHEGCVWADIYNDNDYTKLPSEPRNAKFVSISEAMGSVFYKKALVKNGKYVGPHRTEFEYRVGEVVVSPSGPGIFCYSDIRAAENHSAYNGSAVHCVLELHIESEADISFSDQGQLTLKKAKVVAAHDIVKAVAA